jgi:hypothetical protein
MHLSKKLAGIGIIVGLYLVSSAIWALVKEDQSYSFTDVEYPGVSNVEIEFKDKIIQLKISTDKPIPCDQLIKGLGIEDFVLKQRTYSPKCNTIDPTLTVVTYNEVQVI